MYIKHAPSLPTVCLLFSHIILSLYLLKLCIFNCQYFLGKVGPIIDHNPRPGPQSWWILILKCVRLAFFPSFLLIGNKLFLILWSFLCCGTLSLFSPPLQPCFICQFLWYSLFLCLLVSFFLLIVIYLFVCCRDVCCI